MLRSSSRFLLPILLLLLWKLATTYGRVPPIILPEIEAVGRDFLSYARSGEIFRHTLVSLERCFAGFLLGSALGITSGILLGWFKSLEYLFGFTINFFRAIPKTALAPLLIVWFGFGDLPKVLLIGLASFFYTLIPTIEGVGTGSV
jgi:sulfonate transport system permease protein